MAAFQLLNPEEKELMTLSVIKFIQTIIELFWLTSG